MYKKAAARRVLHGDAVVVIYILCGHTWRWQQRKLSRNSTGFLINGCQLQLWTQCIVGPSASWSHMCQPNLVIVPNLELVEGKWTLWAICHPFTEIPDVDDYKQENQYSYRPHRRQSTSSRVQASLPADSSVEYLLCRCTATGARLGNSVPGFPRAFIHKTTFGADSAIYQHQQW